MQRGLPQDESKRAPLLDSLGFLDTMLTDRQWVATDQFTVADVSLTVTVSQIEGFGMDLKPFAQVTSWLDRCKELLGPFGYKVR